MLDVNFHPFPELTTTRLLLRKLDTDDAEQLLELRSDQQVMKYIGKKPMETLDESKDFINMINENVVKNEGINWAIVLKEEPEKLIGTAGIWRIIKEHYRGEIGYMLLPQYWHRNITKEAILQVLDFGFNELKLHSIEGHINPQNIASAKILESAGFAREAYFKEDFFFNGKFEDTAIYSLLNRNFSKISL